MVIHQEDLGGHRFQMPTDPIVRDLALQRIDQMMSMAVETAPKDLLLANRYVKMAFKLATRHRVRFSAKWNRCVCRKCRSILIPGMTSRVRIKEERSPHVVVTCLQCGYMRRYPFSRGKTK